MKLSLTVVFLTLLNSAFAFEIKVSRMKKSAGYSERYELKSTHTEKVVLDCQSFVQGLLFGPFGETALMLQEWECDDLVTELKKSHRSFRSHCLEVDLEGSVLVSHQTCQ